MTITADMIMPRLGETLDDIAGALKYVDYFFPNYDEACLMTGEKDEAKVADKLFSYGIKNVVMKIGTFMDVTSVIRCNVIKLRISIVISSTDIHYVCW